MIKRLFLLAGLLTWGCGTPSDDGETAVGQSGLALTSDILAETDVAGMRFEITRISCNGEAVEPFTTVEEVDLEDILIPGGIGNLENAPLDAASAHLFADKFMSLPAGCYEVTTIPLDDTGALSEDCLPATTERVDVYEGITTEILLINQCLGEDLGSLDTIATLNHDPELDVFFPDSKFGLCDMPIEVCATATDPDNDPLDFEWTLAEESPAAIGPRVLSTTVDPDTGAVTQCVTYEGSTDGRYDLTVTVYDMAWRNGALTRIETWLEEEGYGSESHVRLALFFYVGGCDDSDTEIDTETDDTDTGADTDTDTGADTDTGSDTEREPFDIELTYLTDVTPEIQAVFDRAAERWQEIVVEDIPDVAFPGYLPANACPLPNPHIPSGTLVDDLRIDVVVGTIDGPGGILGAAAPCLVREFTSLPYYADMFFDAVDLEALQAEGLLEATILHEMAHALGFGSIWGRLGLLENPSIGSPDGTVDTYFEGPLALAAFDSIGGDDYTGGMSVPVENSGQEGTRDGHWRETVLLNELMTGVIHQTSNPLSILTVASMADLGYVVDESAADPFSLMTALPLMRDAGAGAVRTLANDIPNGQIFEMDDTGQLIPIN